MERIILFKFIPCILNVHPLGNLKPRFTGRDVNLLLIWIS